MLNSIDEIISQKLRLKLNIAKDVGMKQKESVRISLRLDSEFGDIMWNRMITKAAEMKMKPSIAILETMVSKQLHQLMDEYVDDRRICEKNS